MKTRHLPEGNYEYAVSWDSTSGGVLVLAFLIDTHRRFFEERFELLPYEPTHRALDRILREMDQAFYKEVNS